MIAISLELDTFILSTLAATSRSSYLSAFTASPPVVGSTCPQMDSKLGPQYTGISVRKLTKALTFN